MTGLFNEVAEAIKAEMNSPWDGTIGRDPDHVRAAKRVFDIIQKDHHIVPHEPSDEMIVEAQNALDTPFHYDVERLLRVGNAAARESSS